ncbi:ABC transporter substrate-binding protein [Haloferax sp. DFSO52]|uniref:ABC transporter substrate-binding protein n=1 Tax=Haloferax sp. DFSO52 TaxID=3388505 RepID=UPI003A871998
MDRREFLTYGGIGLGGIVLGGGAAQIGSDGGSSASSSNGGNASSATSGEPGDPLPDRSILTATAKFDPLRPQIAKIISEEMKNIGVNFEPNLLRYQKNADKVIQEEPDYDMWLVRISSSPARIEPSFHTSNFYGSWSQHNQGWNWMGFEDDEVDFLCNLQGGELNKSQRQQIVYQLQETLREESPAAQIAHPQLLQFYRSDNVEFEGPFTPGEGLNSFWAKVNAKPKGRSEIREAWTSPVDKLNPIAITDVLDLWFARLIYSRLLRVSPDGVPEPYESKELNVISPTEIEIVLDENLTWHDGDPVTAEDVKFTFELYKRAQAPYYNASLQKLDEVTIEDDTHVRFHLTEPTASFTHSALAGVMLLKKEKWETIEAESESLLKYQVEDPVGSGPFKFDSWNRGGKLILSRNEDFVPEPPKIEKIIRTNRDSVELAMKATEQNENDVVSYSVTPNLFDRASQKDNIETNTALSVGYYGLFFNCDRAPFTDPEFRRAIQHIIPRERIVEGVFSGKATPGTSIISPGNKFWNNPDVKPYEYDPEKAKQILRDAGYTWDDDGTVRFPAGMVGVPSEEEVTIPVPDK